jgi:adenylate cyclase class 1
VPANKSVDLPEGLKKELIRNRSAFDLNNVMRVRELLRYGSTGFKNCFRIVPFLLQVNHPDFAGYIESEKIPLGIHGFESSGFLRLAREMWRGSDSSWRQAITAPQPFIESLLLMGSAGSVGHTLSSDLDYWICLEPDGLDSDELELIREKLDYISTWALKTHKTEIHFYLTDIKELSANRMGALGSEPIGEIAPLLLKEETYRTLLLVSGRKPLWWATPDGTDEAGYQEIVNGLEKDSMDFIDLGFPIQPGPHELMAGSLWLSQKSESDLFKAVIKMILLLEQVESGLQTGLLCDALKRTVLSAHPEDLPIDPYVLTIRRVLAFSRDRLKTLELDLVRLSAFLKVKGLSDTRRLDDESPKARLLDELISGSGWRKSRTDHLFNYSSWSEREHLDLGAEIKNFLLELHLKIAGRLLEDYPETIRPEDQNLSYLRARMLARYSPDEAKIEDIPSTLQIETLPQVLTLIFGQDNWDIYTGIMTTWDGDLKEHEGQLLYSCSEAARAAAWLVHNRFWKPDMKLRLLPRPGPLSLQTFLDLLETLSSLFPGGEQEDDIGRTGPQAAGKNPLLLIINLENPKAVTKILSVDLIYQKIRGELMHVSLSIDQDSLEVDKYLSVIGQVFVSNKPRLEDIYFFGPPGSAGRIIQNNLRTAFKEHLGNVKRSSLPRIGSGSGLILDTD